MTETVHDAPTPIPAPSPTALSWPQDRACPYDPPPAYPSPGRDAPLTRMRLFDGREVWLVTGHAEARALLTDPRLSADRRHADFPVLMPRNRDQRKVDLPLLGTDDPRHKEQRRMLIPGFGLKRTAALRPDIERTVDTLLDRMLAAGPEADLVAAYALPLPSMVICSLLGVPYADHEFFEGRSRTLLLAETAEETTAARDELRAYLRRLLDAKRETPGDGLLDGLVTDQLARGELDREELVMMALLLILAGHETTANMISLGTYALLRHPDQLAALRADPALMPGAVEELLRHLSIADGMMRVATEDIEMAGATVRAGEGVMLATPSINRDPAVYADPDALDIRRSARHHVAFGYGVHQCLGQNLARAELEIAFSSLFARIPTLRLAVAPDEVRAKPGGTVQGLFALPVTW
ncbi:cytochrome P450 [Streptomyces sp. AV19]|uniref:cytochrome P450 n=1 Tax=Streptomyces sp. AV19 TaxID=2793068 RepID=UPI0018FE87A9|nr:cytochrome P450 [Streptomyces sp. AV19]MBH1933912.1 cytochrome P450 [Streptomyces sp. AV19]MDG4535604.1 cytochrome P450 [Streptomyces sp. AV19]